MDGVRETPEEHEELFLGDQVGKVHPIIKRYALSTRHSNDACTGNTQMFLTHNLWHNNNFLASCYNIPQGLQVQQFMVSAPGLRIN